MTIAEILKRTGLTQEEIAHLLGVTPPAVSQCLRGRSISTRITTAIDGLSDVAPGTTLALCHQLAAKRRERMLARLAARGITPPITPADEDDTQPAADAGN